MLVRLQGFSTHDQHALVRSRKLEGRQLPSRHLCHPPSDLGIRSARKESETGEEGRRKVGKEKVREGKREHEGGKTEECGRRESERKRECDRRQRGGGTGSNIDVILELFHARVINGSDVKALERPRFSDPNNPKQQTHTRTHAHSRTS